jgi:hypothetical protein
VSSESASWCATTEAASVAATEAASVATAETATVTSTEATSVATAEATSVAATEAASGTASATSGLEALLVHRLAALGHGGSWQEELLVTHLLRVHKELYKGVKIYLAVSK